MIYIGIVFGAIALTWLVCKVWFTRTILSGANQAKRDGQDPVEIEQYRTMALAESGTVTYNIATGLGLLIGLHQAKLLTLG